MQKTTLPVLAFASALLLGAQYADAGGGYPIVVLGKNTDTVFSLGIQYDFGDAQPEWVGGIRHTVTDTGNHVTGAKFDVSIPVAGNHQAPTMRVMGLAGSTGIQGEFGLGYDVGSAQPLLGAGLQGPYINGGINYQLDGKFEPYVGINTLADAPSRSKAVIPPPPP